MNTYQTVTGGKTHLDGCPALHPYKTRVARLAALQGKTQQEVANIVGASNCCKRCFGSRIVGERRTQPTPRTVPVAPRPTKPAQTDLGIILHDGEYIRSERVASQRLTAAILDQQDAEANRLRGLYGNWTLVIRNAQADIETLTAVIGESDPARLAAARKRRDRENTTAARSLGLEF